LLWVTPLLVAFVLPPYALLCDAPLELALDEPP
jgi:hypothetical protein